jgi:hypothetical protein
MGGHTTQNAEPSAGSQWGVQPNMLPSTVRSAGESGESGNFWIAPAQVRAGFMLVPQGDFPPPPPSTGFSDKRSWLNA